MSLKLAENEKVFAQYDYATYGYRRKLSSYAVAKSLIVTNKRVVHQEVSEQLGKELVVRKQLPLEHAKFVDVAMSHTAKFGFLVWTIITAILSLVGFLFPAKEEILPSMPILFSLVGCTFAFLALIFLLCFIGSFRTYLACSIDVDCFISDGVDFNSRTVVQNPKKEARTKKSMQINVRVNNKVARRMADELGAAILTAMDYVPEEKAEPAIEEVIPETVEEISREPKDTFGEVEQISDDDPFGWNANVESVPEEETTEEEAPAEVTAD